MFPDKASIIGIDEAGRGALAGPLSLAAFYYSSDSSIIDGVKDSKLLSPEKREELFLNIVDSDLYRVVLIGEDIIDSLGISEAIRIGLLYLWDFVSYWKPKSVIVDGIYNYRLPYSYISIKKADMLFYPVSMASIIAKVVRDLYMKELDRIFPNYSFARHKGYPTKAHREAIREFGVSIVHRKSYRLL